MKTRFDPTRVVFHSVHDEFLMRVGGLPLAPIGESITIPKGMFSDFYIGEWLVINHENGAMRLRRKVR